MASPTPPSSAAKPPLHRPNTPPEDLKTLQPALRDLQGKRLNAFHLYQEENSLRATQSARAENLAAQLDPLSAQSDTHASQPYHGSLNDHEQTISPAHVLLAELRSLGFLHDVPAASLTWHCLAMAEVFSEATKALAAEPASSIEDSSYENMPHCVRGENGVSSQYGDEVTILKSRLKKAEDAAEAAKRVQQENEQLISRLKQQLDESTIACKGLIELVKEQEETIEKLS